MRLHVQRWGGGIWTKKEALRCARDGIQTKSRTAWFHLMMVCMQHTLSCFTAPNTTCTRVVLLGVHQGKNEPASSRGRGRPGPTRLHARRLSGVLIAAPLVLRCHKPHSLVSEPTVTIGCGLSANNHGRCFRNSPPHSSDFKGGPCLSTNPKTRERGKRIGDTSHLNNTWSKRGELHAYFYMFMFFLWMVTMSVHIG